MATLAVFARTGAIVLAVALLISLFGGYVFGWQWTGIVEAGGFPKRTLWDWLQLLIVPAVLALGGYQFTRSENRRTHDIADQQRTLDREIADERRQDDMLQAYLDGMSQQLTDKERPLRRAQPSDNLSAVARARTLTVLARLDYVRKRSVIQFLHESGLMYKDSLVLDLSGADLSGAYLSGANLSGADLREANLSDADLFGANLFGANLFGANLREANLIGANLSDAALIGADLGVANLRDVNLSGADLSGANLTDAHLIGANLREANLREAVLFGAYLTHADLSGANLREADLRKADLGGVLGFTNEELEQQAESLEAAIMPDGSKHP